MSTWLGRMDDQAGVRDQGSLGPLGISVHRKALEMSCAIQNQLARILAEFEMTLERDVLQPLNRLSEVTVHPHAPSFPSFLLSLPPPDPLSPPCACPQEELPAILKRKKSLQKLVSDWNTLKSRWAPESRSSHRLRVLQAPLGPCGHAGP